MDIFRRVREKKNPRGALGRRRGGQETGSARAKAPPSAPAAAVSQLTANSANLQKGEQYMAKIGIFEPNLGL